MNKSLIPVTNPHLTAKTSAVTLPKEDSLLKPIRYVKGVGPKRSEAFAKLGIFTLEDLFYFLPRTYQDRSHFVPIGEIQPGTYVTVKGQVLKTVFKPIKRMSIFEITIGDDSGFVYAVWFNQPFLNRNFHEGDTVILSGKADEYNGRLQINTPDYELISGQTEDTTHGGRIVPIYPLTEGLGQRQVRRGIKDLVDSYLPLVQEFLPVFLQEKYGFVPLKEAIRNIHFPSDNESFERARARLIFDEFFLFELALLKKIHRDRNELKAHPFGSFNEALEMFKSRLPFTLTGSQEKVLREMEGELKLKTPMRRLLQGDVGSGKTVVAAFLLYLTAQNKFQSVIMAPTEVLAEQHYQTLSKFLAPFNLRIAFLTGNVQGSERGEVLSDLRNHKVDIAVGTHALIQDNIKFSKLGMVVIDEQHKFGVKQRSALLSGDIRPHLLVMTATPIPRTLGLTLYGDLEISVIDELPAGRKPIQTYWITQTKEEEVLKHLRAKVLSGDQAYIIFPIIDETEKLDILAATTEHENLKKGILKDLNLGLIHGRLSKWDKERVMKDFREGKVQVLVATSLIEVGIDNPNATLMVIENAERFGLSQLHQLRGRIGRGSKESFCFLFGDPATEDGKKRLRILTKTTDGFQIAEEDLRLRGPGDFLGTRQSGEPFFKIGDLLRDAESLKQAKNEALALIKKSPDLAEFELLRKKVEKESRHFFEAMKE